ncbi:Hypothetical protein PENO1_103850 [Penicillium occitanis (nom. inval.)]|nr:Hypothetical protein PENO1_103850 [Penicillium occitanis (nom. inval.)]PCG89935.1 hypothetical protein PENOC_104400 [Penicillium occitanis (nom. inval.)]
MSSTAKPEVNLRAASRDKNVGWYLQGIPTLTETQCDLLENYSNIPADEVVPHVLKMRDELWEVYPFPCVGLFRFIDLGLSNTASYALVLGRLKAGASLLDLGCCCGQDLRKLVRDGAPSDNLYGAELFQELHDTGYNLFLDRNRFKANMYQADIFDPEGPLKELEGWMDIVYVGLFLHQFDWEGQIRAGERIVRLMKDVPGDGTISYRHNLESFRKYWSELGEKTGTQWRVDAKLMEVRRDWAKDDKTTGLLFEVVRVK